jgi:PAS domain S-box-containing protein
MGREVLRFAETVADLMPGVMYVLDCETKHSETINPRAALQLLGYSDEGFPRLVADPLDLMHGEDRVRLAAHLERLAADVSEAPRTFEYRMRHADGHWRWFLSRDRVLERAADGKPRRLLGIATDITDRKRAEEKLRDSEQRVRLCTEAAGIGTFIVDLVRNRAHYSAKLAAMLGFPEVREVEVAQAFARVHREDVTRSQAIRGRAEPLGRWPPHDGARFCGRPGDRWMTVGGARVSRNVSSRVSASSARASTSGAFARDAARVKRGCGAGWLPDSAVYQYVHNWTAPRFYYLNRRRN